MNHSELLYVCCCLLDTVQTPYNKFKIAFRSTKGGIYKLAAFMYRDRNERQNVDVICPLENLARIRWHLSRILPGAYQDHLTGLCSPFSLSFEIYWFKEGIDRWCHLTAKSNQSDEELRNCFFWNIGQMVACMNHKPNIFPLPLQKKWPRDGDQNTKGNEQKTALAMSNGQAETRGQ